MAANASEPIRGVAVIRFTQARWNDAVEETAVGIFNRLRDFVGGILMVVPEQDEAANQSRARGGKGWCRLNNPASFSVKVF